MISQETKTVFRQQLPVYVAQLLLCVLMVCVYILIRKYTTAVLLGALAGAGISLANYTAMIFSLLRAEKSENPQMGQLKARGNYLLRILFMAGALILAVKVGHTDPIATL
ncbi:MAG: ATP synthase subunit I, partial [Oscillospiraceae bacterium]|nr:ATP synthase subunit I [Oscillospiraceae bacterium]